MLAFTVTVLALLGLPRVMSTEEDYAKIMRAVDIPANGITLCAGSLGSRPDNDLPGMMRNLGDRVHFLHLRNVAVEGDDICNSFYETMHLEGDTDTVVMIAAVLEKEKGRRAEGRADWNIPMRPDHGLDILDDLGREGQPGYPTIGRMRGLAELRGVMTALSHSSVSAGLCILAPARFTRRTRRFTRTRRWRRTAATGAFSA